MANLPAQPLPEGTRLGVYEIKEAIKTDLFDITYKGWNHHLKQWVEIQEYFPHELVSRASDGVDVEVNTPGDQAKFDLGFKAYLAQAETLTQIEHPNIVEAENVLLFHGTVYLVSSHYEGLTLARIAQAPAALTDAELHSILEAMLQALLKIHAQTRVHGGIQPENIILEQNGTALLTGFAGARLAFAADMAKQAEVLSPDFAAPELYQPGNRRSPASDFYSLGATLYFCIFHKPLPAYQDRLMALSKGEADPLSLSSAPASHYSPGLLQAIDWMLRPGFNDRPQSADEILARLKSTPAAGQNGTAAGQQDHQAAASSFSAVKNPVWLGIAAGIIGIICAGFWLINKGLEADDANPRTVVNQPLAQAVQKPKTDTAQAKDNHAVALPAENSPSRTATQEMAKTAPEKEVKSAPEQVQQQTNLVDNPSQSAITLENSASQASLTPTQPEIKANSFAKKETGRAQKIAKVDQAAHRLKKHKASAPPKPVDSVEGYLAAARTAMKQVRFTTPPGHNAYHYYQQALAKDPGNREALAGKQRIVQRYAWFIRKSKAIGEVGRAERVLKKAESVSPNDPKLQQIREELQNQ